MSYVVPSCGGDLSVTYAPAHHARTTSDPMWSTGLSSSEKPGKRKSRPVLRIITELPTIPNVPTAYRPPTQPAASQGDQDRAATCGSQRGSPRRAPGGRRRRIIASARRTRREVAVFECAPSVGRDRDENAARRGFPRLLQKQGWRNGADGTEVDVSPLSGEVRTVGEVEMVGEKETVGEAEMVGGKKSAGEAGMVGVAPSGRKRFKLHRRTISDKFRSLLVSHRESRTSTIPPSQDEQGEQDEHAGGQAHCDASAGLEVIIPARPYRSPGTASFMVSRPGPDPPLSPSTARESLVVTVDPEASVSDCSYSSGTSTPSDSATVLAATTHRARRCGSHPGPDPT